MKMNEDLRLEWRMMTDFTSMNLLRDFSDWKMAAELLLTDCEKYKGSSCYDKLRDHPTWSV